MEVLRIMKRLCGLYASLEFQFESVLFEELNRQLVSVYLKREAVDALARELDISVSRKDQMNSKVAKPSTQIEDLVNSLKLEHRHGSGRRIQAGALRLESKFRSNYRFEFGVGPEQVQFTRHQFGGTLFSLVSSRNYKSSEDAGLTVRAIEPEFRA